MKHVNLLVTCKWGAISSSKRFVLVHFRCFLGLVSFAFLVVVQVWESWF